MTNFPVGLKHTSLIMLFLCLGTLVNAQLSKIHYVPPVGSGNDVGDQFLYISTPSPGYINVTIKPLNGDRSDWIKKSIKNDEPWDFPVYNFAYDGLNSPLIKDIREMRNLTGSVFKDGYIVESDDVTYLSFRFNNAIASNGRQYHAGAFVSKGEAALGNRFRTGTFGGTIGRSFDNFSCSSGCNNTGYSFISIMATEDNTTLVISDVPERAIIMNYSGEFPLNHTINKHETLILGIESTSTDIPNNNSDQYQAFIGSLVESDKPVVVVSGSINNILVVVHLTIF